jgi:hypothetical protein
VNVGECMWSARMKEIIIRNQKEVWARGQLYLTIWGMCHARPAPGGMRTAVAEGTA